MLHVFTSLVQDISISYILLLFRVPWGQTYMISIYNKSPELWFIYNTVYAYTMYTLSHLLAKINLVWQIVCLFKNKNTTDISMTISDWNVIGTFYLYHLSGWVPGWRSSEKPLQDRLAQVRRGALTSFRCKTFFF